MDSENQTIIKEIVLLGFKVFHVFKIPYFLLFFNLYTFTLTGNAVIIFLVSCSQHLNHPMFFFLSHLSLSDTLLTTNIVPNMLCIIFKGEVTMSVSGCIIQYQFFAISLVSECLLLTVMAYDRYLAICNPLRYNTIMGSRLRYQLVSFCWGASVIISLVSAIPISKLKFCGPHVIDHFFCDLVPLLQLSCSDISLVQLENILLATPLTLLPILIISLTYTYIFITIFKIPSILGRQKAFSTCSSHLAVVGMFYGSLVTLYVIPSDGHSLNANKVLSLIYTVATPLFNPIIYSLRNKEIRVAFNKYMHLMRNTNFK